MMLAGSIVTGFKTGASMFEMSDINLTFTAPFPQQSVLIYGMLQSISKVLILCVLLVWQSAALAIFGVDFRGILVLIILTFVFTMLLQFIQMAIYLFTVGNKKRKILLGTLIGACFVPLFIKAIYEIAMAIQTGAFGVAAERVINSKIFDFTPVLGWLSGAAAEFSLELSFVDGYSGNLIYGGLLMLLLVGICVFCGVYIYKSKSDYYEDAIVAGETRFALQRDLAEGKATLATLGSNKKVKLKKTGVGGLGASAMFHRQMRTAFRESLFGIWSPATIMQIVSVVGFTVAILSGGEDELKPIVLVFLLGMMMLWQVLLIGNGAGLLEQYMHYIFLIPESSIKKLIWSNIISIVQSGVTAAVIFIAVGVIVKASAGVVIACILTYVFFNFYLIGINYAFERLKIGSKGLLIFLYFTASIVFLIPGIVGAAFVGGITGITSGVAVLAGWEILAGFIFFLLAQGVLHDMDMPVMMTRQVK
jgi:hypothetical protein